MIDRNALAREMSEHSDITYIPSRDSWYLEIYAAVDTAMRHIEAARAEGFRQGVEASAKRCDELAALADDRGLRHESKVFDSAAWQIRYLASTQPGPQP